MTFRVNITKDIASNVVSYPWAGMTILDFKKDYPTFFYNQDWYDKEEFANKSQLTIGIRSIYDESNMASCSPRAVELVALYIGNKLAGVDLWDTEYFWTFSKDADGNRVYVGNAHRGLQIHRHLVNPNVKDLYFRVD